MATAQAVEDEIDALCNSEYVMQYLRVDYIQETAPLGALLVHECATAFAASPIQRTAPEIDPFTSLYYEFAIRNVAPYVESWAATSESIAHLRSTLQAHTAGRVCSRGDAAWLANDPALTLIEPLDIILTRKSKAATPVIGGRQSITFDLRSLVPPLPQPGEEPKLPSLEELVCPSEAMNAADRAAVLSYLQTCKIDAGMHSAASRCFAEPPPTLSDDLDPVGRPMSPPIFPRVQAVGKPPSARKSMKDILNPIIAPIPMDAVDIDVAQESMRIISGWAVLADNPSLPSTPPALSQGPSSEIEVDELVPTPPTSQPEPAKGRAKAGKGKGKRGNCRGGGGGGGRKPKRNKLSRSVKATSPPPDSLFVADMEVVQFPRERQIGHPTRSPRPRLSLLETLNSFISETPGKQHDLEGVSAKSNNSHSSAMTASISVTNVDMNAPLSPFKLPRCINAPAADAATPILQEKLDADSMAPMDVPIMAGDLQIAQAQRTSRPGPESLREFMTGSSDAFRWAMSKVPIKNLSWSISWKPIKLPKEIASNLKLCSVVDSVMPPDAVPAWQSLLDSYKRMLDRASKARFANLDDGRTDAAESTQSIDGYMAMTRAERSRAFKRQLHDMQHPGKTSACDSQNSDENLPARKQRRGDIQQLDAIFELRSPFQLDRSTVPSARFANQPPAQHASQNMPQPSPVALLQDNSVVSSSQFFPLSFGSTPSHSQVEQVSMQPSSLLLHSASVLLSSYSEPDVETTPFQSIQHATQENQSQCDPDQLLYDEISQTGHFSPLSSLSSMHDNLSYDNSPTSYQPPKPNSSHPTSPCLPSTGAASSKIFSHSQLASLHELISLDNTAPLDLDDVQVPESAFSRFLRQRGRPLEQRRQELGGLAAVVEQNDVATVHNAASPPFVIPDKIMKGFKPLSLPETHASDGPPHRYLVSNSFSQKRQVVAALEVTCDVELIERETLEVLPQHGDDNTKLYLPEVHIEIDHSTCIIMPPLAELPARRQELCQLIQLAFESRTLVVVVFECFRHRAAHDPLGASLTAFSFSPVVMEALNSLRNFIAIARADGTIRENDLIQWAFAPTADVAAKFVRLVGDRKRESCEKEMPHLFEDLWLDRTWLQDDQYEDELVAATLPSINLCTACLMLSRGSWDAWLDMEATDRHKYLDGLLGYNRTARLNAEIEQRIHILLKEQRLSDDIPCI